GDHHVAWQQEAHSRVEAQRPVRELWIARSENHVALKVHAELLLQGLLHVDAGEHPEALLLQGLGDAGDRVVVANPSQGAGVSVADLGSHLSLLHAEGPPGSALERPSRVAKVRLARTRLDPPSAERLEGTRADGPRSVSVSTRERNAQFAPPENFA